MSRVRIAGLAFVASLVILAAAASAAVKETFWLEGLENFIMMPIQALGLWLPAPKLQIDPHFEGLYPILFFAPPILAISCFWWFIRELAKRHGHVGS